MGGRGGPCPFGKLPFFYYRGLLYIELHGMLHFYGTSIDKYAPVPWILWLARG